MYENPALTVLGHRRRLTLSRTCSNNERIANLLTLISHGNDFALDLRCEESKVNSTTEQKEQTFGAVRERVGLSEAHDQSSERRRFSRADWERGRWK
jgi:hypothetical protein